MPDYTEAGFNNFFRRKPDPPPVREITEDVASIQIPQIPAESISTPIPEVKMEKGISDSIRRTGVSIATSGSVSNNSGIRLTTTLSDSSGLANRMFAICEISVYMDSVSGDNRVPYGSDAIANGHKLASWYDYSVNLESQVPGTGMTYVFHIENLMGSSHKYIFYIAWRYLGRETAS